MFVYLYALFVVHCHVCFVSVVVCPPPPLLYVISLLWAKLPELN